MLATRMVPRFFYDSFIRTALQGIYAGIVRSDTNAEMLCGLENSLTIPREQVGGSEIARRGFLSGMRWLDAISDFIRPEVFASQILTPLKLISTYLLGVRKMRRTTTTLRGLVYSSSDPFFSKYLNQEVVDLSLVVPQLGAAMLYRCPVQAVPRDCLLKEYRIPDAQPIPLVNRIHPSRFPDRLTDMTSGRITLDGYGFLNISLRDLKMAYRSFALENYCMAKSSIYGGKRLGMVCLISGKIRYIDDGMIVLGDILKIDNYYTLRPAPFCAQKLAEDEGVKRERLVGKPVKILCIAWYRYSRGRPENPEALYVQRCEDELEALISDATGYVRLRGMVEADRISETYGQKIMTELQSKYIVSDGQLLAWEGNILDSEDHIISSFVSVLDELRKIRASAEHPFIPLDSILDRKKLVAEHYASIVRRRKLLPILLMLLRVGEERDCLAQSFRELKERIRESGDEYYYPAELDEVLYCLKGMGLIKSAQRGCIQPSPFSHEVANVAVKKPRDTFLEDVFKKKVWLSVFDLLKNRDYPLSILLQGVRELEGRRILIPLYLQGFKTTIAWRLAADQTDERHIVEELSSQISQIIDNIVAVLLARKHSISTEKIIEELSSRGLRITREPLLVLLQNLQDGGRVQQTENNMWFYTWESRITDFLRQENKQVFKKEEIAKAIELPSCMSTDFGQLLSELESRGIIERLGEYFCLRSSDPDVRSKQRESYVKKRVEEEMVQLLEKMTWTDEFTLKARLRIRSTELIREKEYKGLDVERLAEDVWRSLVSSGKIESSGPYIIYRSKRKR
jgi:hypothetical protein